VSQLDDVAGLIVLRTVVMLANEGADAVTQGVASAADVDAAMREVHFELLRFVCGAFAAAACGVLLLSQSCAT